LQLAANGGQFKQVLFPELACPGGQFSRGTHVPFVAGPAVVAFAPAWKTGVGPVALQAQTFMLGPLVALEPLLNKVKF